MIHDWLPVPVAMLEVQHFFEGLYCEFWVGCFSRWVRSDLESLACCWDDADADLLLIFRVVSWDWRFRCFFGEGTVWGQNSPYRRVSKRLLAVVRSQPFISPAFTSINVLSARVHSFLPLSWSNRCPLSQLICVTVILRFEQQHPVPTLHRLATLLIFRLR